MTHIMEPGEFGEGTNVTDRLTNPELEAHLHGQAETVRVKVKPLRWEAPDEVTWLGHGFDACDYCISFQEGSWWFPGDIEDADEYGSLADAQAAAQADFASRILSCIEPAATRQKDAL